MPSRKAKTKFVLTKNIVLIGMMGSGKSTVAQALAKHLKCKHFSTDQMVEDKAKCDIKTLVAKKGWDYFRAQEHKVIQALSKKKGIIIDCGGGVVLNPDNMKSLKEHGIIFFLDAKPTVIYNRLKKDTKRPLLQVANPLAEIKRIYKERLPLYTQADHILDASDPAIEPVIVQILKKIA